MAGFLERQKNALVGLDEALNAWFGGSPRETVSGTVGRACAAGDWWGPAARFLIEVQPWFGAGHCAREAALEAQRRQGFVMVAPPIAAAGPPLPTPSYTPNPGLQTESTMSLNIPALASRVAAVGVTASEALTITNEVVNLIGIAEDLYEGIKGSDKFQAVMSGLDAVVDQMGQGDKLQAIRIAVAPMVNLVVTTLNSGKLWATVFSSIATFAQTAAKELTTLGGTLQAPQQGQGG